MKSAIERHLYGALAVVILIAGIMVYAVVKNTREAVRTSDWVRHTHATILEVQSVQSSLHAGEASFGGFLLTNTPALQESYRQAFTRMTEHLQVLKALTAESPSQQTRVLKLEKLIGDRLTLAKETLKHRETGGLNEAVRFLTTTDTLSPLREIESVVSEIRLEEDKLLQERDRASKRNASRTRWTLFGLAVLKILLLATVFWLVKRDFGIRRGVAQEMEHAQERLESKVLERTLDLVKANDSLEMENLERRWAQATMEQISKRNELIIETIGQPIFVISRRGNVVGVNPAAARATGISTKDLTGRSVRSLLWHGPDGTEDHPWTRDSIHLGMEKDQIIHHEPAWLMTRGAVTEISFDTFPMKANGQVVGAVVTLQMETSA